MINCVVKSFKDYKRFDRENTSFIKQVSELENLLHINCTEYDAKLVIFLIEIEFECCNNGLVDSVKYYFYLIGLDMQNNQDYFYLYNGLNLLLNYVNRTTKL